MRTRMLLSLGAAALVAGCSVPPYQVYNPGSAQVTYENGQPVAYQQLSQPGYQTVYPFYSSYAPDSQAGVGPNN